MSRHHDLWVDFKKTPDDLPACLHGLDWTLTRAFPPRQDDFGMYFFQAPDPHSLMTLTYLPGWQDASWLPDGSPYRYVAQALLSVPDAAFTGLKMAQLATAEMLWRRYDVVILDPQTNRQLFASEGES